MNTITSENLQDFFMATTAVVDLYHSESGETASELFILLQVIETVDNCVDEVTSIELAITAKGYELRYEGDVDEDTMHDHLARALKMAEEYLMEQIEETTPFDNTMSLPSSSRTAGF